MLTPGVTRPGREALGNLIRVFLREEVQGLASAQRDGGGNGLLPASRTVRREPWSSDQAVSFGAGVREAEQHKGPLEALPSSPSSSGVSLPTGKGGPWLVSQERFLGWRLISI